MMRKFIDSGIEVWSGYARELADNGESGDRCVVLKSAPAVGGKSEFYYLDTNGDPVVVGWSHESGEFEFSDSAVSWLPALPWACDAMAAEGFTR